MEEGAGRLTGHHAQEPTAGATAERKQSGVVLDAGVAQDTLRVASDDVGRAIEPITNNLCCPCANMVSLFFELSRDVAHVEACVYGDAGIESSNGAHSHARRTERKGLVERFEAEVRSVNTYYNPIEHTHDPIFARS
jgi:hypothetical protein